MILWTRRKQFSQTCRKELAGKPKDFRSNSEKELKTQIFSLKKSSKCSYGDVDYTFCQECKFLSLMSEKDKRNSRLFFRKLFVSNCSCKHVGCSLGSRAGICAAKGPNFSAVCLELIKLLDIFSCNLLEKLRLNAEKKLSVCENDKKYQTFLKQNSQIDPMDPSKAVFTNRPEKFRQKDEIFRSFPKTIRFFFKFFQKNTNFFKVYPWTCEIPFWQSCRRSFDKKRKK